MGKRRFFEHSSILPVMVEETRLSPSTPRSRTTRAVAALGERLHAAIHAAPLEERAALRRLVKALDDAAALHGQAHLFETLEEVVTMLRRVADSFPGPLQRDVMDGKEVPLAALDAEVTRMLDARASAKVPPRFDHGVGYRKTALTQSRIAARVEAHLAQRKTR